MRTFLAMATILTATAAAIGPAMGQVIGDRQAAVLDLTLDDNLADILAAATDDEVISTLVYLDVQVDTDVITAQMDAMRATLRLRHETVVTALQEVVAETQGPLNNHLIDLLAAGRIERFTPYWIVNAFHVDAVKAEILALAARPDVGKVFFNYPIELIEPVARNNAGLGQNDAGMGPLNGGAEVGVQAVRAPEVWQMGYTGEGILVATLDTGTDGNHPALASRWAGVADDNYAGHPEWAFFDPNTNQTFPFDTGSHGTHTMGSVCGGAPGDEIGVAPGAFWITAAVIDVGGIPNTVAKALLSFQWMLDPDGDPSTNWDVPQACSNSWGLTTGHGYPPCDDLFWQHLDNCEAAGIVIIFSAGNEGSSGLRRPSDRATDDYRTFAVAAVDANNPSWPIASFSSRGPTTCTTDGSQAIKPDIAAPGVNVRSSVPGGGYAQFSGTSMASPHVNGVVALMRQANPDLPVDQIKQIIFDTAFDLGSEGEDNSYGWGMIDAFEAVTIALSLTTLTFDYPDGRPDQISPQGGDTFIVEVSGVQVDPEPGTGLLHVDDGGGNFTAYPMNEIADNVYEAIFPPTICNSTVNYFVSVETTKGEQINNPFNAPDFTFSVFSIGDILTGYVDDFETDQGWTVTGDATTGMWERGVPVGGGDRGDPPTDADGSGQCYVTQNLFGDFDIDNGSTTLTSPLIDATEQASGAILSYWQWYDNSFGNAPETDIFVVDISNNGGNSWINLDTVGPAGGEVHGGWIRKSWVLDDVIQPTNQMRIRFTASDLGEASVVEAGVDGVDITYLVCDSTELVGFTVIRGTLLSGTLGDLVNSDDSHVVTRSEPGFDASEPNVMTMNVNARTNSQGNTIDLAIESRINHQAGTATVLLRNWTTGELDEIGSYQVGTTEETVEFNGIDGSDYIRESDGFVRVRITHVVVATFTASGFDSRFDQTKVTVQ